MTYREKLLDPRWQRKRLEILNRANFSCELCGDASKTLHVHHGYYERGLEPWDYENETLRCLCDSCHEKAQDSLRDIHREIALLGSEYDSAILFVLNGVRRLKFIGPECGLDPLSFIIKLLFDDLHDVADAEMIDRLLAAITDSQDAWHQYAEPLAKQP